jgi:hypothetical protein
VKLRETVVRPIEASRVHRFITDHHYSETVPSGKNLFFGWFAGDYFPEDMFDGGLYAVANYGIGINPLQAQFLAKETGLTVNLDNLLELKRLVRAEPRTDNLPLTYFLSKCHKLLKADGYKHIVSFSDPAQGHSGGIYKASNFIHLGQTQADQFVVDTNGKVRHRRLVNHYAKNKGVSYQEALSILNLTTTKSVPKDRWFYKL